jgi:hypothetical protein
MFPVPAPVAGAELFISGNSGSRKSAEASSSGDVPSH